MSKISNEIKIGFAFIVAIVILYFGISFLKGINIFKPTNSYIVIFDDVTGLTPSTPVTLNGLQIGQVHSLKLSQDNPGTVITHVNLHRGIEIPKGSKVYLDVSLMGSASLILEPNRTSQEILVPNDTIMGEKKKGLVDAGTAMLPKIENIMPRIDSILIGIQAIATNPSLNQALDNVNDISAQLTTSSRQLNQLMGELNRNVPAIAGNLNTASQDLATTTAKFKNMDLESTYKSIDATLRNIEAMTVQLNSKDNSIGLLLNDRQLYDSLNSTLNNASLLLKDVKENPQKYINVKVF